jgi:hypothetical protein
MPEVIKEEVTAPIIGEGLFDDMTAGLDISLLDPESKEKEVETLPPVKTVSGIPLEETAIEEDFEPTDEQRTELIDKGFTEDQLKEATPEALKKLTEEDLSPDKVSFEDGELKIEDADEDFIPTDEQRTELIEKGFTKEQLDGATPEALKKLTEEDIDPEKTSFTEAGELEIEDEEQEEESGEAESAYKTIADLLHAGGSIGEVPEDFSNTSDGLHELVETEIEARKQAWIDELPETAKYLINSYKEGTPLDALIQHESTIQNYEKISTENLEGNEELQKRIISDYNTRLGWDESEKAADINESVNSEDEDALGKKAKNRLSKLIKLEKTERDQLVTQKADELKQRSDDRIEQIAGLKKTLKNTAEIIPGIKLTDGDRNVLFNGITKFDREGKNAYARYREQNPEHDLVSAYTALILKGDYAKLNKAAINKATKKIKSKLGKPAKEKEEKAVDTDVMKKALANQIF